MRRLIRVELARLLARRAVLLLLAAAVILPTLIGVAVSWEHRPVSAAERAEAQRQLEAERNQPWIAQEVEECVAHPRQWLPPHERDGDVEAACREMVEPQLDWYLWRSELNLAEQLSWGSGFGVTVVVLALLMLVGTTFIGHDWATGSVTNQLLFEPRRGRVWTAKAIAVGIVATVAAAFVHAAYWVGLWLVARAYEHGQRDGILLDAFEQGGRAVLLTAAASVGAYAVTMFFRSTVGTLGIMAVVAIAGGIVLGVAGVSPQWHPPVNLDAVLHNGTTYGAEVPCSELSGGGPETMQGFEDTCYTERELSVWQGAAYLGTLLLIAVVLSLGSFRRRDV